MKNQYLVAGAVEGEPEWEREMAQLRPGAEEAPQSVQSCSRLTPPLHVCRRRHSHYQKREMVVGGTKGVRELWSYR